MRPPPARGWFITGTDTGVGKTWLGSRIARLLRAEGLAVTARKPVESGCERRGGELVPADGLAYHRALGGAATLQAITPYRLAHAISPARAARIEGLALTLAGLEAAARAGVAGDDFVLVEGAGGFYSPLAGDGSNADLAQHLGLPLLLVAPDRLGVLNHVLLSAEAADRRGLELAAVVLNRGTAAGDAPAAMDNRDDLADLLPCAVLVCERDDSPALAPEPARALLALAQAQPRADRSETP